MRHYPSLRINCFNGDEGDIFKISMIKRVFQYMYIVTFKQVRNSRCRIQFQHKKIGMQISMTEFLTGKLKSSKIFMELVKPEMFNVARSALKKQ